MKFPWKRTADEAEEAPVRTEADNLEQAARKAMADVSRRYLGLEADPPVDEGEEDSDAD